MIAKDNPQLPKPDIDEADQLRVTVQKELLRYLEGYETSIRNSILIANDVEVIHRGIRSRTKEICFDWKAKDIESNLMKLKERLLYILHNEGIIFEMQDLNNYIEEFFIDKWDIRKVINEMQGGVSIDGELLSL